jgi:hypothetical protein
MVTAKDPSTSTFIAESTSEGQRSLSVASTALVASSPIPVTDMDQSTPLSEGSNTLPNAAYYGLGTGLLFLIVVFLGAVIIILAIVLKMRRNNAAIRTEQPANPSIPAVLNHSVVEISMPKEQEHVYCEINDVICADVHKDNMQSHNYAVLMDDQSIVDVQMDEMNSKTIQKTQQSTKGGNTGVYYTLEPDPVHSTTEVDSTTAYGNMASEYMEPVK